MDDLYGEFGRLLHQAGSGLAGSLEVLLTFMEPEQADRLRLCAIPHQFNPEILQALEPSLTADESREACKGLASLSVVTASGGDLFLQREARNHLFKQWLVPQLAPAFREASRRLVRYFGLAEWDPDAAGRLRMFHLLGEDQDRGFTEFEKLLDYRRHQVHLADCAGLIALVHEYDPILRPEHALRLAYYEGRLAADLREWDRAEKVLRSLLRENGMPSGLRIRAEKRLGMVYADQRKWDDAEKLLARALKVAESSREHEEIVDDIMLDLGCVYRDTGNVKKAEKVFKKCIRIAEMQGDLVTLAVAHDSLGTLYRQLGDSTEAIREYEQSLEFLRRRNDSYRPAQVYTNLGAAYAELGQWEQSRDVLQKGLEIKQKAGDTRGTALALNNLARTYLNLNEPSLALEASTRAAELFRQVRDFYHAALATQNLGKLLASAGRKVEAAAAFERAAGLFEKAGARDAASSTRKERLVPPGTDRKWVGCAVAAAVVFVLLILFAIVVAVMEEM